MATVYLPLYSWYCTVHQHIHSGENRYIELFTYLLSYHSQLYIMHTHIFGCEVYISFAEACPKPMYSFPFLFLLLFPQDMLVKVNYLQACFSLLTDSGWDLAPVIITLTNIGKFSMTFAFGTVVLYAPEIYPTNLR